MPSRVQNGFIAVLQNGIVSVDFRDQQRIIDILRPHVFQTLVRLVAAGVIRAHDELILGGIHSLNSFPSLTMSNAVVRTTGISPFIRSIAGLRAKT